MPHDVRRVASVARSSRARIHRFPVFAVSLFSTLGRPWRTPRSQRPVPFSVMTASQGRNLHWWERVWNWSIPIAMSARSATTSSALALEMGQNSKPNLLPYWGLTLGRTYLTNNAMIRAPLVNKLLGPCTEVHPVDSESHNAEI